MREKIVLGRGSQREKLIFNDDIAQWEKPLVDLLYVDSDDHNQVARYCDRHGIVPEGDWSKVSLWQLFREMHEEIVPLIWKLVALAERPGTAPPFTRDEMDTINSHLSQVSVRLAQDSPEGEPNALDANILVHRKGFTSRLWYALAQAHVWLTKESPRHKYYENEFPLRDVTQRLRAHSSRIKYCGNCEQVLNPEIGRIGGRNYCRRDENEQCFLERQRERKRKSEKGQPHT